MPSLLIWVNTCSMSTLRLFDWPFRASRPYDDTCVARFLFDWEYFAISETFVLEGVGTQIQSSGLVAHENSIFRNLVLAVFGALYGVNGCFI